MEHAEATESMAAERYVLGEMTPEDRDAFEEHFFGCVECAADVRHGEMIRAAVRTQVDQVRRPRWAVREWLTAAAVVAVTAGIPVMQNVALRQQVARMRTPHIGGFVSLVTAGSRGGEEPSVQAGDGPLTVEFEIPPQPNARSYVVEVVDESHRVRAKDAVTADAARDTQHLLFPGGSLQPGRYSLEVHAEPAGAPATVWSFIVR